MDLDLDLVLRQQNWANLPSSKTGIVIYPCSASVLYADLVACGITVSFSEVSTALNALLGLLVAAVGLVRVDARRFGRVVLVEGLGAQGSSHAGVVGIIEAEALGVFAVPVLNGFAIMGLRSRVRGWWVRWDGFFAHVLAGTFRTASRVLDTFVGRVVTNIFLGGDTGLFTGSLRFTASSSYHTLVLSVITFVLCGGWFGFAASLAVRVSLDANSWFTSVGGSVASVGSGVINAGRLSRIMLAPVFVTNGSVFARPYKVVEAEPVGRVALVISKAVAVNGGIGRGGK